MSDITQLVIALLVSFLLDQFLNRICCASGWEWFWWRRGRLAALLPVGPACWGLI